MEIKPVKYEYNHKRRLKPEYGKTHPDSIAQYYAGVYNEKSNNRGYNVSFSGSQGSVDAAKTLMGRIMKTRAFNWLTEYAGLHQVATTALVALFLAGGLRPLFTIALPGKDDMEDKIYAAGQAMSSGIIGFLFSSLITTPIDQGAKYIYDEARKISREDYDKLEPSELAKYIKKTNMYAEDIAKQHGIEVQDIENYVKDKLHNRDGYTTQQISDFMNDIEDSLPGKSDFNDKRRLALGEYVKEKNIDIMPIRKLKNNVFKIVSSKTDRINQLLHENATMYINDEVKKGINLGEVRNLENWLKGIDSAKKNIFDWIIAIPRAALTIALIPPILKYVFHVEKGKSKNKNIAEARNNSINIEFERKNLKSLNEFKGGSV